MISNYFNSGKTFLKQTPGMSELNKDEKKDEVKSHEKLVSMLHPPPLHEHTKASAPIHRDLFSYSPVR